MKLLLVSFVLTLVMSFVEWRFGELAGSRSLVADAAHMVGDAASHLIALLGIWLATRQPDQRRTFGYGRGETIAIALNGVLLFILAVHVVQEGIERFAQPSSINAPTMFVVAVVGLAVNLIVWFLLHFQARRDETIMSAFLHVLGDIVSSFLVIAVALAVHFRAPTNWDVIASFGIAGIIFFAGWRTLFKALHILFEGTPPWIDAAEVRTAIEAIPEIEDVHEFHFFSTSLRRGDETVTLHFTLSRSVASLEEALAVKERVKEILFRRFGIIHSTVEVDREINHRDEETIHE
ncbi:MAG: cation transporter [Parcubacteria group bacterium]|nr:cation transporter [Parcubacteria group bacterium]